MWKNHPVSKDFCVSPTIFNRQIQTGFCGVPSQRRNGAIQQWWWNNARPWLEDIPSKPDDQDVIFRHGKILTSFLVNTHQNAGVFHCCFLIYRSCTHQQTFVHATWSSNTKAMKPWYAQLLSLLKRYQTAKFLIDMQCFLLPAFPWWKQVYPRNLQQDPLNGPLNPSNLLRGPWVRSHSIFDGVYHRIILKVFANGKPLQDVQPPCEEQDPHRGK